jgi:tetratricopeptide (TPR) repeat protein
MKRYLGLITLTTLSTLMMQSSSLANKTTSTSFREISLTTGKVALLKNNKVERTVSLGTERRAEGMPYCGSLAGCNRGIKLYPKDSEQYMMRARFKADELQDYRGAMADYDRAIQISPKNLDHYYERAVFKANKLHDYQSAMTDQNRVVQKYPNDSKSYLYRAEFKFDIMKDYQGGDADCSLAMKYASNSNDVRAVYYECWRISGNKKWLNPSLYK